MRKPCIRSPGLHINRLVAQAASATQGGDAVWREDSEAVRTGLRLPCRAHMWSLPCGMPSDTTPQGRVTRGQDKRRKDRENLNVGLSPHGSYHPTALRGIIPRRLAANARSACV